MAGLLKKREHFTAKREEVWRHQALPNNLPLSRIDMGGWTLHTGDGEVFIFRKMAHVLAEIESFLRTI